MECSEDDIYTITGYDFDWRRVGRRLLGDQKVRDIDREGGSEGEKRENMLLQWKRIKARDATYKLLVKVLRDLDNIATADRVKQLEEKRIAQAPLLATPTTDVPQGVRQYAEYLRSVYNRKPCGDQWSPVVSKCYINLSTVESIEDFPKEKEEICTLAMIHAKVEEVKKLKRSIEIGQVGLLGDGERASCIIVEGIPGIGKSTFSWHLGVCWSQKEILHGYHLVVLLRLRDESVQNAKDISDLFRYKGQAPQEHEAVVDWIRSQDGDGVMMVLDGYDELSSHLQTSSIFADIIRGEVLPKMTVLVSTRPSANQNLHQLCHSMKCQYIEVIGFGKEEIQRYVDGALEHNKELRDQLKSYLEHHPHIHGLMYVPLNCAIVVQVFRDQMKNKSQPPQTHTEVYQLLVKTVLKRHEQKSVKPPAAERPKRTCTIPNKPSRYPWLGDVSEETISQLKVLAKLAYDGTKEDRLIFHGIGGVLETLGMLHEVPELYLESSGSSSYHFIHKTVQEFMAALYVSSLPPGERAKFVRTSFGESNMTMVVRFMAGLTKLQSQDDVQSISAFQKEGGAKLFESLHWLFEAHDPELIQKCMGEREWALGTTLDPFDCYVLGYCIANSRQPWSLGCSINAECIKMLTVVEKGRAFDYIKSIHLHGNFKLGVGDQEAIVLGTMLRENKILTSLGLNRFGLRPKGLCEVLRAVGMSTTLTSLDLTENTFDDQSIASLGTFLRENKVLTSLKLKLCGLGPVDLSEVLRAVESNTTLTSLYLSCNKFDDQSIASLGMMLKENKTLLKLNLYNCGLQPEGWEKVIKGVQVNTKLETLSLFSSIIDAKSASCLGMMLKENNTLKKLDLMNCRLQPEVLEEVIKGVKDNTKLETLHLTDNIIDAKRALCLGMMLKENNTLRKLYLGKCGLQPEGLEEVIKGVQVNTKLETLKLTDSVIDAKRASCLGMMLKENNTLKKLYLGGCRLQPEELEEVIKGVQVNTNLETLDLSDSTIDAKRASCLATALKHNTTLSELGLGWCGLVDEAICELCGGLKWCRLKTLHLGKNPFGEQGAKSLADVIKDNTTSEKLGMLGCDNISYGGVQYLMDAMRYNTTLKMLTLSEMYKHLVPPELVSRVM